MIQQKEKYEENVAFLSELVWNSVFDAERLKTSSTKLLSEIPQEKREGMPMTRMAMRVLNFDKENSNHLPCSVFQQTEFLEKVQEKLAEDPSAVINDLETLRNSSNFFLFFFFPLCLSFFQICLSSPSSSLLLGEYHC